MKMIKILFVLIGVIGLFVLVVFINAFYSDDSNKLNPNPNLNYTIIARWNLGRLQQAITGEAIVIAISKPLSKDQILDIANNFVNNKKYKNLSLYVFDDEKIAKKYVNSDDKSEKIAYRQNLYCTYGFMMYEEDLPNLDKIIWRKK